MLQVFSFFPPVAARVSKYFVFTVLFRTEDVKIVSAAGSIVMESCLVTMVFAESLTWAVNVRSEERRVGTGVVGPVSGRPSGRVPDVMLHVFPPFPPEAAGVCE